ncbi:MAG: 2-C-methyl-D-erythritol 2,4-cyclodiphosphate synthase [Candidatus Cloacimonetes bacterium HGW-Cloacimonetes-3]|nr:MAG: 2-C-methyl-D-erythritol 2,4-cyclodiphosphate synthase [Candidatus Cloacimonetes bacterium HGW-Cloacimonetes-3]
MRIGSGYDVHRLVEGRALVLGGVHIPFELGLLGHSDADVLIHAIIDALLGALALGDIGSHFPDSDAQYRGIDSRKLLRTVYTMITAKGWQLVNLDATICAQAPKLRTYIDAMRSNIAEDLGCEHSQVSVKATTEEGLGVSGKGEGISAYCQLLLQELPK